MTIAIAVSGKGGTGKTTFAALLIRELILRNKTPILAVDADPNSNFGDLLGMKYSKTIADVREEVRDQKAIPVGMSKSEYIDMRLNEIITETKDVDLIVMGRPEGRECYCYVNELLRNFLSKITKQYAYVVMDNEAGMEHLSRRTTDNIDVLFIMSEPTKVSLDSAMRVYDTAQKINLNIKKIYLVINKIENDIKDLSQIPVEIISFLPYDKTVFQLSEKGESIFSLPNNLPIVCCIEEIVNRI